MISTKTITTDGTNVGTFLPMRTEFTGNGTPKTKLSLFSSTSTAVASTSSASSSSSSMKRSHSFKDTKDRHSTGSSSGYSSAATSIVNGKGFSSLPNSPNGKNESMDDMNATNMDSWDRIKNGEKFIVRGRRTNLDGTKEYLIEWCGKKLF